MKKFISRYIHIARTKCLLMAWIKLNSIKQNIFFSSFLSSADSYKWLWCCCFFAFPLPGHITAKQIRCSKQSKIIKCFQIKCYRLIELLVGLINWWIDCNFDFMWKSQWCGKLCFGDFFSCASKRFCEGADGKSQFCCWIIFGYRLSAEFKINFQFRGNFWVGS